MPTRHVLPFSLESLPLWRFIAFELLVPRVYHRNLLLLHMVSDLLVRK